MASACRAIVEWAGQKSILPDSSQGVHKDTFGHFLLPRPSAGHLWGWHHAAPCIRHASTAVRLYNGAANVIHALQADQPCLSMLCICRTFTELASQTSRLPDTSPSMPDAWLEDQLQQLRVAINSKVDSQGLMALQAIVARKADTDDIHFLQADLQTLAGWAIALPCHQCICCQRLLASQAATADHGSTAHEELQALGWAT